MISLSIARSRALYSKESMRAVVLLSIAFQYLEELLRNPAIVIIGWEQILHHGRRSCEKVVEEGDAFVNNKGEQSRPTEEESSHT